MTASKRRLLPARITAGLLLIGAASLGLTGVLAPTPAAAAPSQEDVDRARQAERVAEMNVAQIEIAIAEAASQADNAAIDAAFAAEEVVAAQERLDEAITAARVAKEEAQAAEAEYQESLTQLASIAQLTYRTGGAELDSLAPYIQSDGLRSIEKHRSVVSSFGGAADTQMQEVAALRQVADILDEVAEQAQNAEQEAYDAVEEKLAEAEEQAELARQVLADTEATKAALIEELAARKNTTAALEAARIAEAQRVRDAEAQNRVEQEAQGSTPPSTSTGSNPSTSTPSTPTPAPTPAPAPAPTPAPTPTPAPAPKPTPTPTPTPTPAPAPSGNISTVISYARSKIGAPYVWGGNGPGYDCSGITYMAYKQIGITLPRTASGQYYVGRRVPLAQAQAGDLVFWARNGSIYHVALHSGNGRVISAHKPGTPLDEGPLYLWDYLMPYVVRVV